MSTTAKPVKSLLASSRTPSPEVPKKTARAIAVPVHALGSRGPVGDSRSRLIADYALHLEVAQSIRDEAFSHDTKTTYLGRVSVLDGWIQDNHPELDFQHALTPLVLNRFFRDHHVRNSFRKDGVTPKSPGTAALVRNLQHFVKWATITYGIANPFDNRGSGPGQLHKYKENPTPDSVISEEAVEEIMEAARRGRHWLDVRDFAMMNVFRHGPRVGEVALMSVHELHPTNRNILPIRTLKKGGNATVWRELIIDDPTSDSLKRWVHRRGQLAFVDDRHTGCMWPGGRGRHSAMTDSGIRQMLDRRAQEAGYPKGALHPHMFRHTRVHELKKHGYSDEAIIDQAGFTRQMLDTYGSGMAKARVREEMFRRLQDKLDN